MSDKEQEPRLTVPKFSSFKASSGPKEGKSSSSSSSKPAAGKRDQDSIKAPKFSSFKSKETVPRDEPRKRSRDRGHDRDRDRHRERDALKRSRHSDDHRHRHSKHRRHESHHRDSTRERSNSEARTRGLGQAQAKTKTKTLQHGTGVSGLYVIDMKGDPLISQYGDIDRSLVPSYRRYGSTKVLGTTGRLILHHDGPRPQFSLRMPGEGFSVKDRGGLRSKSWRGRTRSIRIRTQEESPAGDEEEDFLEVRPAKRQKRDGDSSGSGEDEEPSYRSIEGKAKPHQYSDSELDYDSEPQEELALADQSNPLKSKSIQLQRQTKDHPEDIDAWLELVQHQDDLLRAGEDVDRKVLEGEKHSYVEIKLSMLESALSHVSKPEDRERVLVPLMREGCKVWPPKVATKRWAEMLEEEETSFPLWKTHIDFVMSNLSAFQFEDVKKMYIQRLGQAISRFNTGGSTDFLAEAIYVFLRATRFIHDSGYKELAVAAWQAFLEMNLFRPQGVDDHAAALDLFADFWESEVPRVGDPQAHGWKSFVESNEMRDPLEPVSVAAKPAVHSRDEYKHWALLEASRAENAKVPARTMDEGTEDDPFRVVMFSDIEPLLFLIPREVLSRLIEQLLDAFLTFLHFPPVFKTNSWTETALQDQSLVGLNEAVDLDDLLTLPDESAEDVQRRKPSFDQAVHSMSPSLDVMFAGSTWFNYMTPKPRDRPIEFELVKNVTGHLAHTLSLEGLATDRIAGLAAYHLMLCWIQDPGNIKKPARALLKKYARMLTLWNAFSLAELRNGNFDVGELSMSSATELSEPRSKHIHFQLWRSWSMTTLERGDMHLATKRLCSSVDEVLRKSNPETEVTPTDILKARGNFQSELDHSISVDELICAEAHAKCLILLDYLTADGCTEPKSSLQGNISAAMQTLKKVSDDFQTRGHSTGEFHERLLQFAAQLLYLHTTKGPFRRAFVLEQLTWFIDLFPRNTIFLALFEWADSGLRIIDEVRTLLHEKTLTPLQDCVTSRIFAIQHELRRGNIHTTRAAFEDALASDACKHSVVLWRLFIRFCARHKELRPKAKDVFFRALRHCPWSKDLLMEAFGTLSRDMDSAELRSVFNTMTSKGLRVHVDLEEFLEERHRAERSKRR